MNKNFKIGDLIYYIGEPRVIYKVLEVIINDFEYSMDAFRGYHIKLIEGKSKIHSFDILLIDDISYYPSYVTNKSIADYWLIDNYELVKGDLVDELYK